MYTVSRGEVVYHETWCPVCVSRIKGKPLDRERIEIANILVSLEGEPQKHRQEISAKKEDEAKKQ